MTIPRFSKIGCPMKFFLSEILIYGFVSVFMYPFKIFSLQDSASDHSRLALYHSDRRVHVCCDQKKTFEFSKGGFPYPFKFLISVKSSFPTDLY